MTTPPYINDLIDMIRLLSEKIDNLENKLNNVIYTTEISSNSQNTKLLQYSNSQKNIILVPDFTPEIGFQKWIMSFNIDKQDVTKILSMGILDGFKDCLITHIKSQTSVYCSIENISRILDSDTSALSNNTLLNIEKKPIWVSGGRTKQIYVYDLVDCATNKMNWKIISDDDICILIEIIWRKIVHYYFIEEEELLENIELTDDEKTQRDINKKILLDMKKKLIHRHIKDIMRIIIQIL